MPLTLNTPLELASAKKESVGVLEIMEHQVSADHALVWLGRRADSVLYPIPGFLKIEDVPAKPAPAGWDEEEDGAWVPPPRKYVWGGREFEVPPGTYFTSAVASAPVGASVYAVVKNALYAALGSMYGLTGSIS